jgi:hypothetical protein
MVARAFDGRCRVSSSSPRHGLARLKDRHRKESPRL